MTYDGKFGWEVMELELPFSIVERYCVKRYPPDLKGSAVGRIVQHYVMLPADLPPPPKPDNDPTKVAEDIE